MLKMIRPDTPIRIKKKSYQKDPDGNPITIDEKGRPINPEYMDIINEDILVEWHNRHGMDKYQAASLQATDAAYIRLWYIPDITSDCKIVKVEDGAEYEIVGKPDDIMNRHQLLEIELKGFTGG